MDVGVLDRGAEGANNAPCTAVGRAGDSCREGVAPPAKGVQGCNPGNFCKFTCKTLLSAALLDDVGLHVIMSKKNMNTMYRFRIQM
jgi:hypothetical protein